MPAHPAQAQSRALEPVARGPVDDVDDNDDEDEDRPGRGRGKRLAIAAAILLLLGGGGFAAYKYRAQLGKLGPSVATTNPAATGPSKPGGTTAGAALPMIAAVSSADPGSIDAEFQKRPLWALVKKEFPDWYGERLKEIAKLKSDNQEPGAIAKHIVQQLVALRRQHADQALSASTARLKTIAQSFVANLNNLKSYHINACYSFISQGETSPAAIDLMQTAEHSGPLHDQAKAIFEAVAEGRRAPSKHAAPSKTDYDALADQLTKLGWSQGDLQLFADPRALSRSSPDRVCKMVQDWFHAHIAITDQDAQERLLFETLRPVVAG